MPESNTENTTYIRNLLPSAFQDGQVAIEKFTLHLGQGVNLGEYLDTFEQLFFGEGGEYLSIDEMIEHAAAYTNPDNIPREQFDKYGTWLLYCLGLFEECTWKYYYKKDLLKNAIALYRVKGTRAGLEAFFTIFTQFPTQVVEILGSFGIGYYRSPVNPMEGLDNLNPPKNKKYVRKGKIGYDTVLKGPMEGNIFIINTSIESSLSEEVQDREITRLVTAIDEQKPVQSFYQLNVIYEPLFQVGMRGACTVGINSIIREVTPVSTRTKTIDKLPTDEGVKATIR